jgi:hypothetical protein
VLAPRTPVERRIISDPRWLRGVAWGEPRDGHPEGAVVLHVVAVLENVERLALDDRDRDRLRFIALVHDSLKADVDPSKPKVGDNDHAVLARRFAEEFTDDAEVLVVIETHDDAYRAWRCGQRAGDPGKSDAAARALIARLGAALPLYLRFYEADNAVPGKSREHRRWFTELAKSS